MEYNFIKVSKSNGVLRVTLNRPEKRNAFTPTTVSELAYTFNLANEDPQVKVVLLDAEGPVFCSGMDLKVFNDPTLDLENPHIPKQDISLGQVFDQLLKPSIAVVQGAVIAGGFLMIL
ncbi:MAG TPA: enoyl-CoA hydratase/isomerase family protein, partial [Candidatus Sphingobacterium stercoripullorum]|nr:enoyl-CoA hydratase/isomerase family protein [Candidatus Sphingobacterium stercoripullorum]